MKIFNRRQSFSVLEFGYIFLDIFEHNPSVSAFSVLTSQGCATVGSL